MHSTLVTENNAHLYQFFSVYMPNNNVHKSPYVIPDKLKKTVANRLEVQQNKKEKTTLNGKKKSI